MRASSSNKLQGDSLHIMTKKSVMSGVNGMLIHPRRLHFGDKDSPCCKRAHHMNPRRQIIFYTDTTRQESTDSWIHLSPMLHINYRSQLLHFTTYSINKTLQGFNVAVKCDENTALLILFRINHWLR